jgi:hypothetical protein
MQLQTTKRFKSCSKLRRNLRRKRNKKREMSITQKTNLRSLPLRRGVKMLM